MYIVYSSEDPPEFYSKSLFLAGPTPRNPQVTSWRPEALALLEAADYDGVVFVPEFRPGSEKEYKYPDIPVWEHKMLDMADCILFWIPRNMETMPALTTNIELGLYAISGKVVIGAPVNAEKIKYPLWLADKFKIPQSHSLAKTIDNALKMIGDGALRYGGEREVPLYLWNTHTFQSWYQSQKQAGNRLDGVKIYWTYKIGPKKDRVFYWAIHPNIYIASENRNKTNEAMVSRFDISAVMLYKQRAILMDSEIVLIREFRSPARNSGGFVWELPGGSSFSTDPLHVAVEEVFEEVGLKLDQIRFKAHNSRQMAATMTTHCGTLYSVELTDDELEWCKKQKGIPRGADFPDNPTGERAYIEVLTLREIQENNLIDWSNLGMILSVINTR